MKTRMASVRSLGLALFWTLTCTSVFAQDIGSIFEPNNQATASTAESDIAANFRLKGVFVSQTGRSALINNKVSREGDRVGQAEILAITEGAVQILVGSREFTLRVGSSVVSEQPSGSYQAQFNSDSRHASVRQGETLSHIAQRHLTGEITMNQMMIALFEANPQAFGGNINVLREGATLRIPDQNDLQIQSPAMATAAVVRHMDAWQTNNQPRTQLADVIDTNTYGPVASGETLSDITVRVSHNGTSMNQMMIALFEANPEAFGGNINILYKDAVLRIPEEHEMRFQGPEAATAEVLRHMDSWRPDAWQQLRLASVDASAVAVRRTEQLPTIAAVLTRR